MSVANNPQTFLNSYLSAVRNSIISFTLGIAIFGFSKTFKSKKSGLMMRLLSILLYTFSLGNGLNSCLMLHSYLKKIDSKDNLDEYPEYIDFNYWKGYLILGYAFCVVLAVLFFISSERFIAKLL